MKLQSLNASMNDDSIGFVGLFGYYSYLSSLGCLGFLSLEQSYSAWKQEARKLDIKTNEIVVVSRGGGEFDGDEVQQRKKDASAPLRCVH